MIKQEIIITKTKDLSFTNKLSLRSQQTSISNLGQQSFPNRIKINVPKKDKKKHAMKGKAIEGDKCLWNRRLKMKKKEKLNYKSPKN